MEAIFQREIIVNKSVCRMIGIISFVILTSLGAFVRIPLPFTPVPVTLQTFFVLLSGLVLGARDASISQLGYILLGVVGLPIFANAGSGLLYLTGPTGGYLVGFVLATIFLGRMMKIIKVDSFFSVFILACLANLILFFSGMLWLKIVLGCSLKKTLLIGFFPFIPGDLFKVVIASSIFLGMRNRIKEIF